jgi:SAM-dependent methyltransferase
MTEQESIWENPERVEEFATREADTRMMKLVTRFDTPAEARVLDLGCAAGRNAVVLAALGFDAYAVDSSAAMIERTRARVAEAIGEDEAKRRVVQGFMDDLSRFGDASFDMVLGVGVYHNAHDRDEWERSLSESSRILKEGGLLLVANFSPRCNPDGQGMHPVEGEPGVYIGFGRERLYLREQDDLDADMRRHGLTPEVETVTVTREVEKGVRVIVNALYRKTAS